MAPVGHILMKLGFYIVTVEVGAAVAMYLLLPRILSRLRGRSYRSLSDLMPPPDPAVAEPALRLAGHDLNPANLIRMEVDGDLIRIDIPARRLDVALSAQEIADRLETVVHPRKARGGALERYAALVKRAGVVAQ